MGSQTHRGIARFERGIFLLALAAVLAVTALDLIVADRLLLLELLAVGPVIAAVGATARHTSIVAVLALVSISSFGTSSGW